MQKLTTILRLSFALLFTPSFLFAAGDTSDIATYLAGQDRVELFDIFQLDAPGNPKDKSILIAGTCANLDWLPTSMLPTSQRTMLSLTASDGTTLKSDSGGQGFMLRLSPDMKQILEMIYLPAGSGTTITRIRTTVRTGDPIGELYISGKRYVNDSGTVRRTKFGVLTALPKEEYYIARLDKNFANGRPTTALWYVNPRCRYDYRIENLQTMQQPWDVNNKGEVVYGEGAHYIPLINSFSFLNKIDAFGHPMAVPGWMMHTSPSGQITYGYPAPEGTAFSQINGYQGLRGSLRSHNAKDYAMPGVDGNGNSRNSKFPDDYFYRRHVDSATGAGEPSMIPTGPLNTTGLSAGPGRTGRVADHPRSYGWSAVVFDKVTNKLYVGYITGYYWQSPLDTTVKADWDVRHEFDPQIIAFDTNGFVTGWDRLKKEASNDQPDSYLDALDIDYANNMLVVLARQHGNDYNTSWIGNEIAANPAARGFKNTLNGTTGNIHIQWLGKFRLSDLRIFHSTFVAEYISSVGISNPYSEPNYDGWQNQNSGNGTMNTTRRVNEAANTMKVGRNGVVALTVVAQRSMTTADAFQKMDRISPDAGSSSFIRVYTPNLSDVIYSTIWSSPDAPFSNTTEVLAVLPQKDRTSVVFENGISGEDQMVLQMTSERLGV